MVGYTFSITQENRTVTTTGQSYTCGADFIQIRGFDGIVRLYPTSSVLEIAINKFDVEEKLKEKEQDIQPAETDGEEVSDGHRRRRDR